MDHCTYAGGRMRRREVVQSVPRICCLSNCCSMCKAIMREFDKGPDPGGPDPKSMSNYCSECRSIHAGNGCASVCQSPQQVVLTMTGVRGTRSPRIQTPVGRPWEREGSIRGVGMVSLGTSWTSAFPNKKKTNKQ